MCSLENVSSESVTCLAFADSYMRKSGEFASQPGFCCSKANRLRLHCNPPIRSERAGANAMGGHQSRFGADRCHSTARGGRSQNATGSGHDHGYVYQPLALMAVWFMCWFGCRRPRPGGTIFRSKGSILSLAFLDCSGALIPYSYETWRGEGRAGASGGGTGMCEISRLLGVVAVVRGVSCVCSRIQAHRPSFA